MALMFFPRFGRRDLLVIGGLCVTSFGILTEAVAQSSPEQGSVAPSENSSPRTTTRNPNLRDKQQSQFYGDTPVLPTLPTVPAQPKDYPVQPTQPLR
jgi:hypothetical protein